MSKAADFVAKFEMLPHPEGGFYKETYRSEFSTGIYYLLEKGQKSKLHRIKSDELWHFYAGDALVVVELTASGIKETLLSAQTTFQHLVSAGIWFGAYLPDNAEFALVGCTVAPAFRFEDFEMGDKQNLLANYPSARNIIEQLMN